MNIRAISSTIRRQPVKFGVACIAALSVLIAGYLLVHSKASGFFAWIEPEGGSTAGNAQIVSDSSASGGKAIKFNAPASNPTPPPTPPPTTPSTSTCAPYPSFPDASCTGPTGTLTAYTGPMEIKTAGAVIENVLINTSMLTISANNVTLRNCKIVYNGAMNASFTTVYVKDGVTGTVFDHCEIDGQAKVSRGINAQSGFTVKNCNIHDTGNGVEADRNFTVQESYIWNIKTPDGQDWHSDGVQGWGDANDVTIDHNTILLTGGETGAVNFVGGASQSNNLVQHNLLAGGGYTIYVGSETKNTNVRVINNHLSTRYSPKVGLYGIWYFDANQTPGVVRSGNVIHETGAPAD